MGKKKSEKSIQWISGEESNLIDHYQENRVFFDYCYWSQWRYLSQVLKGQFSHQIFIASLILFAVKPRWHHLRFLCETSSGANSRAKHATALCWDIVFLVMNRKFLKCVRVLLRNWHKSFIETQWKWQNCLQHRLQQCLQQLQAVAACNHPSCLQRGLQHDVASSVARPVLQACCIV